MKKKVVLAGIIVTIIALGIIVFNMFADEENEGWTEYENYLIKIESSDYCKETSCGRIDMIIKKKKSSKENLFATNDDVLHNGNKLVGDLNYGLNLFRDGKEIECHIQETERTNKEQHIVIKYIHVAPKSEENTAKIEIYDAYTKETKVELITPEDTETESVIFTSGKNWAKIYVSSHGMFIDYRGYENGIHIWELKVEYKDGNKNILFSPTEGSPSVRQNDYVQVEYQSEDSREYIFGWDFGELSEVDMIEVNSAKYFLDNDMTENAAEEFEENSINSLEDLEKEADLVVRGRCDGREEPVAETSDSNEGVIRINDTAFIIDEVYKNETKKKLEKYYDIMVRETEHIKLYQGEEEYFDYENYIAMSEGSEYILFLKYSDIDKIYIPLEYGRIPVDEYEDYVVGKSATEEHKEIVAKQLEISRETRKKYSY